MNGTHPNKSTPMVPCPAESETTVRFNSELHDTRAPSSQCLLRKRNSWFKISLFPKRLMDQFQLRWVTNSASYKKLIYFQNFSNSSGAHANMNHQVSIQSRTKQILSDVLYNVLLVHKTFPNLVFLLQNILFSQNKFQHPKTRWRAESSALHPTASSKVSA